MRRCPACGEDKGPEDYYRTSGVGYCKPCWRAYVAAYRSRDIEASRARERALLARHPERTRERARAWRQQHPEVHRLLSRVAMTVQRALKSGALVRPDTCSRCGFQGRQIQAAHHDYSKPLDVTWLCSSCHVIEDHRDPKTKHMRTPA